MTLKINGIPINQLTSGTKIDETTRVHSESWNQRGSYLSNKEGVRDAYEFQSGLYTEKEAEALMHIINGNFHAFTYDKGLESGTGLRPINPWSQKISTAGCTLSDKIVYKLPYDHCFIELFEPIESQYYSYDSLTDTHDYFDTQDMIISYKSGLLTVKGTGTIEYLLVLPMSNVPTSISPAAGALESSMISTLLSFE